MLTEIWNNLFVLGIPVLEKIIRPVLVYFFLLIGLRLAGKRELAQLNPFDLIVLLTISNTVQNAIIGHDETVWGGMLGAATLLAVNYLMVLLAYKHEGIGRIIEGSPAPLIENGRVLHDSLKKEMLTEEELTRAAHRQGFASLANVDRAVLEPGGQVTFEGKQPAPEEVRHHEILSRLNQLAAELTSLRASIKPA